MTYEQHDETFHNEMSQLKEWVSDPELITIPCYHIEKMWVEANNIMKELDQLDAMGTNIPSLTLAALRIKALIFTIPENLNIEHRRERCQYEE